MKLSIKAGGIFDGINESMSWFISGIIIVAMLLISYDVTVRFLLNRPLAWATEITEYMILYITFLGAAWVLKDDGHVKIDVVFNRLKPRTQAVVNAVTSVLGAISFALITWYAGQNTRELFVSGYYKETVLEFPTFHLQAVITIGCFLLFIQLLRRFYKQVAGGAPPSKEQGLQKAAEL